MSWVQTKATGSGELRYALVIEGWPESWVTDKSITHSLDSETVRVGLSAHGITIHDRVIMHEARCEQSGITFKIVPPAYRQQGASQWSDNATASFTRQALPLTQATANLAAAALTMPAIEGGGSLSNSTTYYMGSEAIRVGTWPTISARGYHGSIDQSHFVPTEDTDGSLYIWDYPPTMEGRRVKLYVWGDSDTGADEGTLIWRGIVRRPPVLDRDGVTWQIQCSGIVDVLKQSLAGDIKGAKVVGIYHHASCAVRLRMQYGGSLNDRRCFVGWHASEAEMMDWIGDEMSTELVDIGADTFISSLKMTRGLDDSLRLELRTGASGQDTFTMELSSPIIGGMYDKVDPWINASTGDKVDGFDELLDTSATYYVVLRRPHETFFHPRINGVWAPPAPLDTVNPLGYANEIMMPLGRNPSAQERGERWQTDDATEKTDNPPWRVYVDQDFASVSAVYIPGTDKPGGVFIVNTAGSTAGRGFWIDVEPWTGPPDNLIHSAAINGNPSRGFMGFLDGSTEIRARRNYGRGTVADFIAAVKTQAPLYGNKADTPFVTSEDAATWALANGALGVSQLLAYREYVFFGSVELDKMLYEELKLVNHYMRIASDGRIDIAPMPALTPTSPVAGANIIAANDIITPADGYGAWPTWEPMRDGRITTVRYQAVYDAITEEWVDPPAVFMDGLAVSLSKTRGKSISEIKPYSVSVQSTKLGAFDVDAGDIRRMATRYLTLFARDYYVVTVCVPFEKFDILCGGIVSLTSQHVPDGTGKRGITSVRGVVIERSWPMDPKGDNYGKLTIMLVQGAVSGYAPAGIITGQVNTSGTTWTLTFAAATINVGISTNGDGLVLEHFANGDFIRIVEFDDFSPTIVTGVISGSPNVAAGTCVVVLDGAWTPGGLVWSMEFQDDTDGDHATAAQEKYAYVANDNLTLQSGAFARRFA